MNRITAAEHFTIITSIWNVVKLQDGEPTEASYEAARQILADKGLSKGRIKHAIGVVVGRKRAEAVKAREAAR